MRHSEAIQHLGDFEAGTLNLGTESELRSHVETCFACRQWIATFDLLAEHFASDEPIEEHPDSGLLALCSVRADERHEPDREDLCEHLERCSPCRSNLDLVTEAVVQARSRQGCPSWLRTTLPATPANGARALAAGLVALFLGAGLLLTGIVLRDSPWHPGPRSRTARVLPADRQIREISGTDFSGTRVVHADGGLAISRGTVKRGADVSISADGLVALGNGFRVESGGRLRVASSPTGRGASDATDAAAVEGNGEPSIGAGRESERRKQTPKPVDRP